MIVKGIEVELRVNDVSSASWFALKGDVEVRGIRNITQLEPRESHNGVVC